MTGRKEERQLRRQTPRLLRLELARAEKWAKEAEEYLAEVMAEPEFYDKEERATWRAEAKEAKAYLELVAEVLAIREEEFKD